MPKKQPGERKAIEPPALSGDMHSGEVASLSDHDSYTQLIAANAECSGQAADDVLFEQAHLKASRFNETQLTASQWLDVRFESCDVAGAVWEKAYLRRVEWLGCRLVGMQLSEADVADVLFDHCNGEFAQFAQAIFRGARFDHCSLREASFEGANAAGVVFHDCDLSKADFRGAKLRGADFRGSIMSGMQVGYQELQGAIIDPTQALQVAQLLGITVKPAEG